MELSDEKGICFFAYNNEQIDYIRIAILAASYAKKNLGLPVCLITDDGSNSWLEENYTEEEINHYFDYIVFTDVDHPSNLRKHMDSPWTEFAAPFKNSNKHKIWDYSPFEKTLLLDIDYFLKTDFLLDFMDMPGVNMYDNATNLRNNLPHPNEVRLSPNGISMWWSTVVCFDRSEVSKVFFDTWAHVADNYNYYQMLYNFPPRLFRTDYCVSIAVHIMNGMQPGSVIGNFADSTMLNMSQKDDIYEIVDSNNWIFLANDNKKNWLDILVKQNNYDVHVMNKRSITRHYNDILESARD